MKQVGDYGDIIISDDVIKRIIEETAEAVEGVAELSKNVKISQKDDRLQVDLFVTIYYGGSFCNNLLRHENTKPFLGYSTKG